jgi:hypothetical protein
MLSLLQLLSQFSNVFQGQLFPAMEDGDSGEAERRFRRKPNGIPG